MSSYEAPPNQTLLYALEVPSEGGKTGFNNMYAAYETLPADLRERVRGLELKHDATIDAAGYVRKRFADADPDLRRSPGAVHPLVRTHPETGRACLYLGRRSKAYVTGLPLEESEALLDALWAHASLPQLAWYHGWRAGDLVMWDNRCVMHRRDAFDPNARRTLHRVVVKGTKPFFKEES
jgi:taurine dioxygenase